MPAQPAISNNTPLVALWVLNRLDLLRSLFGEVLIPNAVYVEFIAIERIARQHALRDAPWVRPVNVADPRRVQVFSGLGPGEAEVLALAQECGAGLVIMDEAKGRRYAQRMGLPLTGTLGVLLLAKERGLVVSLAPLLTDLQAAGLRLHPALIARVLEIAGERA